MEARKYRPTFMYSGNSSQYFSGYDVLNTDAVDGITAAFYPVPLRSGADYDQLHRGDGESQVRPAMKLLAAKTEQ